MRSRALALALLALAGCDDPSTTPPDAAAGDAFLAGLRDADPPDLAPPDGPPLDFSPPRDARYDAAPPADDGPHDLGVVDSFAECDEGALRCAPDDPALIERCRGGRWQAAACGAGAVCREARCLPDPAGCVDGDRVCLAPDTPGACDPGAPAWRPLDPCPAGRRCRAGACEPEACADAAEAGSYLGCAFAAVPLPNFAQIYTPDTPVGLVLTNPGDAPVALTALGPDGALGALVAEHQVTLSDDPRVPEPARGRYGPETVRSEVRDAAGQVVAEAFAEADALPLPPGGTATLLLPPAGADTLARSGAFPLAWRILTDGPVAAYQFAPFCCNFSFSNDASLLFPEAALGTDHRVAGAPVFAFEGQPAPATVAVAAPSGATVTLRLPEGASLRADATARTEALPDGVWRLALAPGEVWLAHVDAGAPGDPTGAQVQSDRPVAVFSSHLCSFVPHSVGFCDHLEEQLPPVEAWGRRYALVPPPPRGRSGADQVVWWRLVPEAGGTEVTLSRPLAELGEPRPLADAGLPDCRQLAQGPNRLQLDGPCELATAAPLGVVADAPLLVVGLLGGQDLVQADSPFGTRAGDPSLFLVPPDRQLRRDYAFLVPGTYALDFLTVVAGADVALTLDGAPLDMAAATPIPGTARVFLHVPLGDGGHRVVGDGPFAIRVTAFDDFVSYALTGGLDLRKP